MGIIEALLHGIIESKPVTDYGQGDELTQFLTEIAGMFILVGVILI